MAYTVQAMEGPEIIEAIREALRLKGTNPSRLAKENGWSVNAVRYILEGRAPSSRRLAEVCKALDLEFYVGPPRFPEGSRLSVSQLAGELERLASEARRIAAREKPAPLEAEQRLPDFHPEYISAPLYEVLAAAGGGSPVGSEVVRGFLGFNRTWVREQQLTPEKLAVIEVQGDSMEPTLHDGDIVLLDLRTQDLQDGSIYTLRRDEDLLVKRLRRHGSDWLIHSDNLAYPTETLDPEVTVVGRVAWLGRTL